MFLLNKSTFILSLSVILLTLSACNQAEQFPEFTKNVVTTKIKTGTIQNNFNLTGSLEATQSAYISAKNPGRITELYKDVGESVQKNELIGKLGGEENQVNLQNTYETVQNLEQNKINTKNLTQKQIENTQKELQTAQHNLELLKLTEENINQTSQETLKSGELSVEQAYLNVKSTQSMLTDTEALLSQEGLNLSDNAKTAITQALILVNMTETFLDNLLGVSKDKEHNNDSFEKLLGSLDSNSLSTAKETLRESIQLNQELQDFYDIKINLQTPNEEDLEIGLELAEKTLEKMKTAIEDGYIVLSNSSTNDDFTLSTLNSYQEQLTSLGSQIENATLSVSGSFVIGVKGVLQGSENLKVQSSISLNQASNNLAQAEKMYEISQQELTRLKANLKMQKDDIRLKQAIAETQMQQVKLSIETAQANQSNQLQLIETQLDQARNQETLATINISNTEIRAPFAGVITEKLIEVGTVINAGTPIFKIETADTFKIKTEVSETEIDFIQIGQTAYLNSDILPNQSFTGEVSKINPAANSSSHKIGIEIQINALPKEIKLGTIFNIILTKEKKGDAIIIPLDSLIYQYNQTFVFRITDNKAEKTLVEPGITSGNSIEILKGLSEKDQIVTKGQHNLRDGDKVNIINEK